MIIRLGWFSLLLSSFLYFGAWFHSPPEPTMPLSPEIIPQTDILIDVGHGGIDGGTSHKELLEKDLNLQLARKLYEELSTRPNRYKVVINRTGDYALSDDNGWKKLRSRHRRDLVQRKEIVNQLKPKLMVSLHVNWAASSAESGGVVLYQNNPDSTSLAKAIQASLNNLYEQDHAPVYGKAFFLLKHSKVPSVIVEMGFISSAADRRRLTEASLQEELARAIADGIEAYLDSSIEKDR